MQVALSLCTPAKSQNRTTIVEDYFIGAMGVYRVCSLFHLQSIILFFHLQSTILFGLRVPFVSLSQRCAQRFRERTGTAYCTQYPMYFLNLEALE